MRETDEERNFEMEPEFVELRVCSIFTKQHSVLWLNCYRDVLDVVSSKMSIWEDNSIQRRLTSNTLLRGYGFVVFCLSVFSCLGPSGFVSPFDSLDGALASFIFSFIALNSGIEASGCRSGSSGSKTASGSISSICLNAAIASRLRPSCANEQARSKCASAESSSSLIAWLAAFRASVKRRCER